MVIAILILLISGAAIIVGWVMASNKKPTTIVKEKEVVQAPAYMTLDNEISTAMNGHNRGSVIVKVAIEIKDQETLKQAKAWEPMISTEISSYLSRRTFEELEGTDNMTRTSEGIKDHLNQSLAGSGLEDIVKSVLFNKYIVQQ